MPTEIDPEWEYATGDPEIEYCVYGRRASGVNSVPVSECPRTGRKVMDGYRVTTRPDKPAFTRLAPPKPDRPDRLPVKHCKGCPRVFTPRCREQVYCTLRCHAEFRTTPPRSCEWCGKTMTTKQKHGGQRYCSRSCGGEACSAQTTGVPRSCDWQLIAGLYAAGRSTRQTAEEAGVCRPTVVRAAKAYGVYRGPEGGGANRVLPDVACRACGAVFRPAQGSRVFCSKACSAESQRNTPKACAGCGCTFTPKHKRVRYCTPKCYLSSDFNRKKKLQRKACAECGAVFQPRFAKQTLCSRRCVVVRSNKGKLIDVGEVMRLRATGLTWNQVAERMGRSASGVREAVQKPTRGASDEQIGSGIGAGRPAGPVHHGADCGHLRGRTPHGVEVDRHGPAAGAPAARQSGPAGVP